MTSWGIWCEVTGGITGHRMGWLKRNGRIVRYRTREAASIVADRENARKHRSGTKATFRYTPRQMEEDTEL